IAPHQSQAYLDRAASPHSSSRRRLIRGALACSTNLNLGQTSLSRHSGTAVLAPYRAAARPGQARTSAGRNLAPTRRAEGAPAALPSVIGGPVKGIFRVKAAPHYAA